MDPKRTYNSIELYHLNTIAYDAITDDKVENQTEIIHLFWWKNPHIMKQLLKKLSRDSIRDFILDVGCGGDPFPKATHIVDFSDQSSHPQIRYTLDLDTDRLPVHDLFFQYVYCRHTLEDIQNPQHAFQEITRLATQGYIETPSPLVECLRNIDDGPCSSLYRGYIHHRYLVWSDHSTHTLYFLPKYPLIEHLAFTDAMTKRMLYLVNHYPVYWNNYYVWDRTRPPKIVVYRNGINMDIVKDYPLLVEKAILTSIEYTNQFIPELQAL